MEALTLADEPAVRPEDDAPSLSELLVRLTGRERWRLRAACQGEDPELFAGEDAELTRWGRQVCAACPVARECLDAALDGEEYGLWGGTTEAQRRSLRESGLSTRAIASATGASVGTVHGDLASGVQDRTPEPEPDDEPDPDPAPVKGCGTPAAYQRHRKRGETPCDDCREAHRRAQAARRAAAAAA